MEVEEFDREKKNLAWKMTAERFARQWQNLKGFCEIVGRDIFN